MKVALSTMIGDWRIRDLVVHKRTRPGLDISLAFFSVYNLTIFCLDMMRVQKVVITD